MEKKQTAVEWLVSQQQPYKFFTKIIIEQAKEIEKEQIIDASAECWKANMPDGFECKLSAKEYYEESFKQDNEN